MEQLEKFRGNLIDIRETINVTKDKIGPNYDIVLKEHVLKHVKRYVDDCEGIFPEITEFKIDKSFLGDSIFYIIHISFFVISIKKTTSE